MGILKRLVDDVTIHLPADALLGRGLEHDVPLTATRASAPHARLRWTHGSWELCDLGSLNGTFVNDARMGTGQRKLIAAGDVLRFGDPNECYRLDADGAPAPLARHIASGRTTLFSGELLLLPNADKPVVCIYTNHLGEMVIEAGERMSRLVDREVMQIEGELWQLRALVAAHPTTLHSPTSMSIDKLEAHFAVSGDNRDVRITLVGDGQKKLLKPRAFHQLLLLLARARIKAEANSEGDQSGWVHRDELCRQLQTKVEVLNVDIYRARQQFAGLGVLGAPNIIERRTNSRAVRLGVARVVISE